MPTIVARASRGMRCWCRRQPGDGIRLPHRDELARKTARVKPSPRDHDRRHAGAHQQARGGERVVDRGLRPCPELDPGTRVTATGALRSWWCWCGWLEVALRCNALNAAAVGHHERTPDATGRRAAQTQHDVTRSVICRLPAFDDAPDVARGDGVGNDADGGGRADGASGVRGEWANRACMTGPAGACHARAALRAAGAAGAQAGTNPRSGGQWTGVTGGVTVWGWHDALEI